MVSNLQQGVLITLAGMGLVFLVLALLWLLMALMLRLDRRRVPAAETGQRPVTGSASAAQATADIGTVVVTSTHQGEGLPSEGSQGEVPPEMLSAVMVAVRMHRRVRRKQAAPMMRTHQPGTLPSRWVGAGRTSQNQSWHPRHK